MLRPLENPVFEGEAGRPKRVPGNREWYGTSLEKGVSVGYTTDLFGNVLEEYKATEAGVILYMLATPPINSGDTVMCIVPYQ